jgi:hypothetical protein
MQKKMCTYVGVKGFVKRSKAIEYDSFISVYKQRVSMALQTASTSKWALIAQEVLLS